MIIKFSKDFLELLQEAQNFDSAYCFLALNLLIIVFYLIIVVNFLDRNDPQVLMQTKLFYFVIFRCPVFVVHLFGGFYWCLILGKTQVFDSSCNLLYMVSFFLFCDMHSTCNPQSKKNSDLLQIIVQNVSESKHMNWQNNKN